MSVFKLPKEARETLTNNFRDYFIEQTGDSIGTLAAESLVLYIVEQLGPYIYNQAVEDVSGVVRVQMDRIDEEIYALRQPFPKNGARA